MHKYYFKIRKNNTEIEFSTDNLEDFDKKVIEWVDGICSEKQPENANSEPKRMDFIEIRDLVKINKIAKAKEEPKEIPDVDFEQILEETIINPRIDLDKPNTDENELNNLFIEKQPKHDVDYLVITAFYMLHYENIMRFSIKQVNSRIVPLNHAPVTHNTIQESINHGLIEIVPDLTGLGDITEYALTQRGEEYYHNEL